MVYVTTPVSLNTYFLAIGTNTADAGKPIKNPAAEACIHLFKKFAVNPTFIETITKDITKLIPKEIIRPIKRPAYLGLMITFYSPLVSQKIKLNAYSIAQLINRVYALSICIFIALAITIKSASCTSNNPRRNG